MFTKRKEKEKKERKRRRRRKGLPITRKKDERNEVQVDGINLISLPSRSSWTKLAIVRTPTSSAACGITLSVGKQYLITAYGSANFGSIGIIDTNL